MAHHHARHLYFNLAVDAIQVIFTYETVPFLIFSLVNSTWHAAACRGSRRGRRDKSHHHSFETHRFNPYGSVNECVRLTKKLCNWENKLSTEMVDWVLVPTNFAALKAAAVNLTSWLIAAGDDRVTLALNLLENKLHGPQRLPGTWILSCIVHAVKHKCKSLIDFIIRALETSMGLHHMVERWGGIAEIFLMRYDVFVDIKALLQASDSLKSILQGDLTACIRLQRIGVDKGDANYLDVALEMNAVNWDVLLVDAMESMHAVDVLHWVLKNSNKTAVRNRAQILIDRLDQM